jgi:hypothetical protein
LYQAGPGLSRGAALPGNRRILQPANLSAAECRLAGKATATKKFPTMGGPIWQVICVVYSMKTVYIQPMILRNLKAPDGALAGWR